jgi:hypothetical protein
MARQMVDSTSCPDTRLISNFAEYRDKIGQVHKIFVIFFFGRKE